MLSKFASLLRGKFEFKNQVWFQNSSSFILLHWVRPFSYTVLFTQRCHGEVVHFLFTGEETKLEGPSYLPKIKELRNGWPQTLGPPSPVLSKTLLQPQFLSENSQEMQQKSVCQALYLGQDFFIHNWCSAIFVLSEYISRWSTHWTSGSLLKELVKSKPLVRGLQQQFYLHTDPWHRLPAPGPNFLHLGRVSAVWDQGQTATQPFPRKEATSAPWKKPWTDGFTEKRHTVAEKHWLEEAWVPLLALLPRCVFWGRPFISLPHLWNRHAGLQHES